MTIDQCDANVGLWRLVLDRVKSFIFVPLQRSVNFLVVGGLNVIDVIGEKYNILHRVDSSCSGAGKELCRRTRDKKCLVIG